MRRRRRPGRPSALAGLLRGRDRGSFTAELAAGLPALMLLLFAGLTAVVAVTTQGRCVDAAREGAIVAARGGAGAENAGRIAPPGAAVAVVPGDDTVTVTVRARVTVLGGHLPMLTVESTAVAAREPEGIP
ncbi:TadE family type IV pilus minor pilin [Actinoplanes sp. NPDC049548]|uniref:TadE family type IV pilus minor pilin n=1 Tax=Actinoplanes sp. NPDC049548 TaxID=3155152 RepID=UPI00341AC087